MLVCGIVRQIIYWEAGIHTGGGGGGGGPPALSNPPPPPPPPFQITNNKVVKGARYLLIIQEVLVAMDFFFCRGARSDPGGGITKTS